MARKSRQERQQEEDLGVFAIGTLIGGLVGAAAAFWFAPQSGRETRHEIAEQANNVVEEIENVADETRRKVAGESMEESLQTARAEARRFQETWQQR